MACSMSNAQVHRSAWGRGKPSFVSCFWPEASVTDTVYLGMEAGIEPRHLKQQDYLVKLLSSNTND